MSDHERETGDDPAEEVSPYLDRLHAAAADGSDSTATCQSDEWDSLSEAERRSAMTDRPVEPATAGRDEPAPTEPGAVDWHAFTREFNFHFAGVGCQNRHTSPKKLREAVRLSEHIGTSDVEGFLADAVADEAVPLVADAELGYLFAEEVLADG